MNISLENQKLSLLCDRALFWPDQRALFVADLHLGKANHFQTHGLPIPDPAAHDLARLARLTHQTDATNLYLLGDLFHSPSGNTTSLLTLLRSFFNQHHHLKTILIRGNHDPLPHQLRDPLPLTILDSIDLPPFRLAHKPPHPQNTNATPAKTPYVLSGHTHPAISLRPQKPHRRLTAPCFHITPSHTILPAFGSFTGTHPVLPSTNDRIIAVADHVLTEIPPTLWPTKN
ncbi:MAG: ligase-associated DNA damage response endonuclease PdeM [Verrucomicrobiota bacterium]